MRPILATKGPDCVFCAEATCSNALDACSVLMGTVDAGPAAGASKAELCVETTTCFVSKGCSINDPVSCYCDINLMPPLCFVDGPCKKEFERSMESTDPAAVFDGFADMSKSGNRALLLLQCLKDNRCKSCFATADGGADATDESSGDP